MSPGISIENANNNFVFNNYIGLASDGVTLNPVNQRTGVGISGNAASNVIGGQVVLAGGKIDTPANVISGNKWYGVNVGGSGASNRVQGNFIGSDKSGLVPKGNGYSGVNVGANDTVIGGLQANLGNVIGNNGDDANAAQLLRVGVYVSSNNNTIGHNKIGPSNNGQANHGNFSFGLYFAPGAQGTSRHSNVFKHNLDGGLRDPDGKNRAIDPDTMSSNGGLGIDIGVVGVTTAGMPVLTGATVNGLTTTVTGTLNSTPLTTFRIDFFGNVNVNLDPSGHGEGERLLGFVTVTTNASGFASYSVVLDAVYGTHVTATATDLTHSDGGTSEFALNVAVTNPSPSSTAAAGLFVWEDTNGNGQQDVGELGLAGVYVELLTADGESVASAETDANGRFVFTNVPPGDYILLVAPPDGYGRSPADQGGDATDSDFDPGTGMTDVFTLIAGEYNPFFGAGVIPVL